MCIIWWMGVFVRSITIFAVTMGSGCVKEVFFQAV